LHAGDVVVYWDPIFVAGHPLGRRSSRIILIDRHSDTPLCLDNGDRLGADQQVRHDKYVQDGELVTNERGMFKYVSEYVLHNSIEEEYKRTGRMSYARALGKVTEAYRNIATEHNMPIDIVYWKICDDDVPTDDENGCSLSSVSNANSLGPAQNEDDNLAEESRAPSAATEQMNFHAVVAAGSHARARLEEIARNGKKKQAVAVNQARMSNSGEIIGKWMMCTLAMPADKNDFTPKNLPVMVCGHYVYTKTRTIRYR